MKAKRRMWLWIALALLAVIAAVAGAAAWRFRAAIASDVAAVQGAALASSPVRELSALLAAHVARTQLPATGAERWFRITQTGEMRMQPDGAWQSFTADQVYSVGAPAFVWSADFGAFQVVDSVVDGVGRLEARLFGVWPLMRAGGPSTTRAQLQRYLAEIVWVPGAFVGNDALSWQGTGERDVLGALEHAGFRVEMTFTFDAAGDIVRVAGMRERDVQGASVLTPWVGRFAEYRTIGGVRIPTYGEVQWGCDADAFVYWRATVTGLRVGGVR